MGMFVCRSWSFVRIGSELPVFTFLCFFGLKEMGYILRVNNEQTNDTEYGIFM